MSLSQHLGTDHLFPMDVHVVASILGCWLSEATAAEADLCVPYVAQSSQTGRVSAATRLKAAPNSSQKDAKGARKVLRDSERSVTIDAKTRFSDCKGQASPTSVQALEQSMVLSLYSPSTATSSVKYITPV